jgi:hypothetical protein
MFLKLLLTAGLLIALSGCAGVGAESTLKFSGDGNGTHSDTPKCDDQGALTGSGNVPDGSVMLTVKDSAGKQLLQQTFKGEFTLAKTTVSGAAGTWSVVAQRSSDDLAGDPFSGHYAFYVNC